MRLLSVFRLSLLLLLLLPFSTHAANAVWKFASSYTAYAQVYNSSACNTGYYIGTNKTTSCSERTATLLAGASDGGWRCTNSLTTQGVSCEYSLDPCPNPDDGDWDQDTQTCKIQVDCNVLTPLLAGDIPISTDPPACGCPSGTHSIQISGNYKCGTCDEYGIQGITEPSCSCPSGEIPLFDGGTPRCAPAADANNSCSGDFIGGTYTASQGADGTFSGSCGCSGSSITAFDPETGVTKTYCQNGEGACPQGYQLGQINGQSTCIKSGDSTVDCAITPTDPSCPPPPLDCVSNPSDPACPPPPDPCTINPTDPACTGGGTGGDGGGTGGGGTGGGGTGGEGGGTGGEGGGTGSGTVDCLANPGDSACFGGSGTGLQPCADGQTENCSPADKGTASGGGDCSAAPTCSGDPIQCAQLFQQWKTRCEADPEINFDSIELPNNDTLTFSGSLDNFQTTINNAQINTAIDQFFTVQLAGSCPTWSVTVPVFGAIIFDQLCSDIIPWSLVSGVLITLCLLLAARIALT